MTPMMICEVRVRQKALVFTVDVTFEPDPRHGDAISPCGATAELRWTFLEAERVRTDVAIRVLSRSLSA